MLAPVELLVKPKARGAMGYMRFYVREKSRTAILTGSSKIFHRISSAINGGERRATGILIINAITTRRLTPLAPPQSFLAQVEPGGSRHPNKRRPQLLRKCQFLCAPSHLAP